MTEKINPIAKKHREWADEAARNHPDLAVAAMIKRRWGTPETENGPVGFALDDGELQASYADLWRVPVEEMDAALRLVGHAIESAAYLIVSLHLSEHADDFESVSDVVNWLGGRTEVSQKATSDFALKLAEIRQAQQRELAHQLAALEARPNRIKLSVELAEQLGLIKKEDSS